MPRYVLLKITEYYWYISGHKSISYCILFKTTNLVTGYSVYNFLYSTYIFVLATIDHKYFRSAFIKDSFDRGLNIIETTLLLLEKWIKFFEMAIFQNADFRSLKLQERSISITIPFIKYLKIAKFEATEFSCNMCYLHNKSYILSV